MKIGLLRASTLRMFSVAGFVASSAACSLIPVKMNTAMTVQHADGTVEHKETHWEGTLDQMPAQLSKAGDELAEATGKMVKELTDVPPPGKVKLGDLGPGLDRYAGNKDTDFLLEAKDDDGKPIDFQYVQLGVASYDDFFKQAQVVYALCYQADQTIHRMAELSGKILNEKVDASADLKASVSKALGQADADASLVAELKSMSDLAASLATEVASFAKAVVDLVTKGQALITGAAASLTNPKVITHLGLIKDGLGDSVSVIKDSGDLLVKLAGDLGGFVSGGGSSASASN